MKNIFFARAGNFFKKWKSGFLILSCGFIFYGCASSDVIRDVTSNIDVGVQNTRNLVAGSSSGDIADTYQNSSQVTKGALIGGAAGGITAALTSAAGIVPGVLVGAVMGASYGSYIETNETLEDRLQNRGAIIVTLGDQVLIVLPSARIFNAMSAKIKPSAYSTLNLVAQYLNGYTKMLVKISGYTNAVGNESVNLALSQAQADSVAKYLAVAGADARLLYAVGYGGTQLVQRKTCDWAESDNYRIEITLEKQYV